MDNKLYTGFRLLYAHTERKGVEREERRGRVLLVGARERDAVGTSHGVEIVVSSLDFIDYRL